MTSNIPARFKEPGDDDGGNYGYGIMLLAILSQNV